MNLRIDEHSLRFRLQAEEARMLLANGSLEQAFEVEAT